MDRITAAKERVEAMIMEAEERQCKEFSSKADKLLEKLKGIMMEHNCNKDKHIAQELARIGKGE
jgi:hypothetical protein